MIFIEYKNKGELHRDAITNPDDTVKIFLGHNLPIPAQSTVQFNSWMYRLRVDGLDGQMDYQIDGWKPLVPQFHRYETKNINPPSATNW